MNGRRSLKTLHNSDTTPSLSISKDASTPTPTQRFLTASSQRRPRTRYTSEPPTLPAHLRYGPTNPPAVLYQRVEEAQHHHVERQTGHQHIERQTGLGGVELGDVELVVVPRRVEEDGHRDLGVPQRVWERLAAMHMVDDMIDDMIHDMDTHFARVLHAVCRLITRWWKYALALLLLSAYLTVNLGHATHNSKNPLSDCPPTFLHHPILSLSPSPPNPDLNPLLALPPRLFPTWSPPLPIVQRQLRRLKKCWHADKLAMHCRGVQNCTIDAAFLAAVEDVYSAVGEAAERGKPTVIGAKGMLGVKGSEEGRTGRWQWDGEESDPGVPDDGAAQKPLHLEPLHLATALPAFNDSCASICSLSAQLLHTSRLALTPYPWHPTWPTEPGCICPLPPISMLRVSWSLLPPRNHPLWSDPSLTSVSPPTPFTLLLYTLRLLTFSSNHALAHLDPCSIPPFRKARWIRLGWAEEEDFEACTVEGLNQGMERVRRTWEMEEWVMCLERNAGLGCGEAPEEEFGEEDQ